MQVEAARRVMGSGSVEWNLCPVEQRAWGWGDLPIPVWKLEVSRGRLCLRGWCQDPAGGAGVLLGLSIRCGVCSAVALGAGGASWSPPPTRLLARSLSSRKVPLEAHSAAGVSQGSRTGQAGASRPALPLQNPGPGVGVAHPP